MSRKTDDELFREATEQVERTIASYRGEERVLVGLLIGLYVCGLGLLVFGAATGAWQVMAPGGLTQAAVIWPLRALMRIREENRALLVIPRLIRLAGDSAEMKQLTAKLVTKLIEKL